MPRLCFHKIGALTLAMTYSRTTYRRTTIGAEAFHFRVRDGNGWDHHATTTRFQVSDLQKYSETWISDGFLPDCQKSFFPASETKSTETLSDNRIQRDKLNKELLT